MVRHYIKNILIALDQLANTIIGGDPDETISSRTEKAHRGDFGPIYSKLSVIPRFIINLVFWPFDGRNHCQQSLEEDEGHRDLLNR